MGYNDTHISEYEKLSAKNVGNLKEKWPLKSVSINSYVYIQLDKATLTVRDRLMAGKTLSHISHILYL